MELPKAPEQVLLHRIERIQVLHERAPLDGEQHQRIGLICSSLSPRKGIDVAIRALAQLEDKALSLHILGEGDQMQWREYAAKWGAGDQVHIYDPLRSGKAVWEWLDQLAKKIKPLAYNASMKRESAERNYLQSHHYANAVLDKRRSAFWRAYADAIK